VGAVVLLELIDVRRPGFADEHGIGFVGHLAHLLQDVMHLRELGVVLVLQIRISLLVGAGQDRIVGQLWVFEERVYGIQAKAGDAALVPPAVGVEHSLLDRWIAPVQVRLLGIKVMIVILLGSGIEFPRRPAESRNPVIGGLPRSFAVA